MPPTNTMNSKDYDEGFEDGYESGKEDTLDKLLGILDEAPEGYELDDIRDFLEAERGYTPEE